jgi:type I restriction-modification system DNA methylase subunit
VRLRLSAVLILLNLPSIDFLAELPFPVCLFFFTLDKDQGYYKWILEPVIEEQGNSKLHFNQSHEFKKLTDEGIDNIISTVNRWYDSWK